MPNVRFSITSDATDEGNQGSRVVSVTALLGANATGDITILSTNNKRKVTICNCAPSRARSVLMKSLHTC
jgi:hypothetical protein